MRRWSNFFVRLLFKGVEFHCRAKMFTLEDSFLNAVSETIRPSTPYRRQSRDVIPCRTWYTSLLIILTQIATRAIAREPRKKRHLLPSLAAKHSLFINRKHSCALNIGGRATSPRESNLKNSKTLTSIHDSFVEVPFILYQILCRSS